MLRLYPRLFPRLTFCSKTGLWNTNLVLVGEKDFAEIVEHGKTLPQFHWNGRRLFLNDRSCVPNCLCNVVVQRFHERGHFGVDKTCSGITRKIRH